MSTSSRTGFRPFPATLLDERAPLDAYTVRDVVFNNAQHLADEAGSVWVNEMTVRSAISVKATPNYQSPDTLGTDVWNRLTSYGPFNLTLFDDRTPYKVRVRLFGADVVGDAAGGAYFAVTVGDFFGSAAFVDGSANSILFASTVSTTPAWLSPSVPASDLIAVEAPYVERGLVERVTLVDTGGAPTTVTTCEVFVTVWAKTQATSRAGLYGLHVQEYLAP